MKDLAYLNAGAARQVVTPAEDPEGIDSDGNGYIANTVASDVDADFNGKIDMYDLSILDADGANPSIPAMSNPGFFDITWSELDSQGNNSSWDNDSFKEQTP